MTTRTQRSPVPSPREASETSGPTSPLDPTDLARVIGREPDASPTSRLAYAERRVANRYRLGPILGAGGFGTVFEAFDAIADRHVAIKLLGVRSERELQRFRYETTSLRLLQVPGVVRLLDDGVDSGEAYIVMERAAGRYFPGAPTPATWDAIARPALALLEALARVHALGVIHRDLKPSNVLVDEDGTVTILDLGVSALRDLEPSDRGVVGTPAYLAPEQATGTNTDARADLYTVGVMLFEALSGALPHGRTPADAVMTAKVTRRAPPLRTVAPGVAEDVAQIVDWLLEPHPADRPMSALEVVDALLGREAQDPIVRHIEKRAHDRVLDVARLAAAFAGPDRFLHVPQDAASLAIERVGTASDAVANEVGAWVRAGLARWDDSAITVDRAALHRIVALPLRQRVRPVAAALAPAERDLLVWISLAGPLVEPASIARAADLSPSDFGQMAAALESAGVIRTSAQGGYATDASLVAGVWPTLRVRQAHRRFHAALRPGHPARMTHAILAAEPGLIVAELDAFSVGAIREGHIESARAILCEALRVLRRDPDPRLQDDTLLAMARLALTDATVPAYDQLLYELGCCSVRSPMVERLAKLAQAARLAEQNDAVRALQLLTEVGAFDDPWIELRRRSAQISAARWLPISRFEEMLAEQRSWAEAAPEPAAAHFAAWQARLGYRRGRFDEAARIYLRAGSMMESAHARLRELTNAAASLIEVYDGLDQLITLAGRIQADAAELRVPFYEARGFWIERAARYRRGDDLVEDVEAVAASHAIGVPWTAGLLTMQEAAIAWRRHSPEAPALFERAVLLYSNAGFEAGRVMARLASGICALHPASGSPDTSGAAIAIATRESTPPGVALQVAAMAVMADPTSRSTLRSVARRASEIPATAHRFRREILSVDECLAVLEG